MVNGKNLMLEEYLKHLEQDLQDNESEIEIYKHIKKEKAIY